MCQGPSSPPGTVDTRAAAPPTHSETPGAPISADPTPAAPPPDEGGARPTDRIALPADRPPPAGPADGIALPVDARPAAGLSASADAVPEPIADGADSVGLTAKIRAVLKV